MFQLRFHGRGGHGVVTAAELLAETAFIEGRHAQAFPSFGSERMGAPVMSFCRINDKPIAVGINSIERFLGDEALRRGWKAPVDAAPTGKRVLVVGARPSGLSAAYHLTRLGHSVTIKDAGAAPGMMRYGIPKYRLPRDILDAGVNRIVDMGLTLELNAKVTDILGELNEEAVGGRPWAEGGFDAAFVAVGAHIGRRADGLCAAECPAAPSRWNPSRRSVLVPAQSGQDKSAHRQVLSLRRSSRSSPPHPAAPEHRQDTVKNPPNRRAKNRSRGHSEGLRLRTAFLSAFSPPSTAAAIGALTCRDGVGNRAV
jgi:hypothetical protein